MTATSRHPSVPARPAGALPDDAVELRLFVLRHFRQLFKSVKSHFQTVEVNTGVSGSQLWALAEIAERGGARVGEIADVLSIKHSTASNLIDRLEQRGLVARERDRDDQRVVRVTISERGSETLGRAPRPFEGVLPDALDKLGKVELALLAQGLQRLEEVLAVRDASGKETPLADL